MGKARECGVGWAMAGIREFVGWRRRERVHPSYMGEARGSR